MLIWKIKAEDFPLFYDEEKLTENNLLSTDIIDVVFWYNGVPETEVSLEQLKNMYCMDCYYPNEIEDNTGYWLMWEINRYSSYPVLLEKFIEINKN